MSDPAITAECDCPRGEDGVRILYCLGSLCFLAGTITNMLR